MHLQFAFERVGNVVSCVLIMPHANAVPHASPCRVRLPVAALPDEEATDAPQIAAAIAAGAHAQSSKEDKKAHKAVRTQTHHIAVRSMFPTASLATSSCFSWRLAAVDQRAHAAVANSDAACAETHSPACR